MIRYALTCDNDHTFESWFQSARAYDALRLSGHVNCAVCGSSVVDKMVMAPSVQKAAPHDRPLAPAHPAIAALRDKVEAEADYVGPAFAIEARAIHDGEKPERPIYGEATAAEARSLINDGVPVLPLPFIGRKHRN